MIPPRSTKSLDNLDEAKPVATWLKVEYAIRRLRTAPASADVELFHHSPNHILADSELLSNFVLAQVGPSEKYFSQPGIEAESYLFDAGSQIYGLDLHSVPLRCGRKLRRGRNQFVLPNPWGEPPPDGSPYGGCIHRDKCRFWLQTVNPSQHGLRDERYFPPHLSSRLIVHDEERAFREALNQDLPPLPWRWRQQNPNSASRASRPPSDPHATPSSLGLRPPNASDSRARGRKTQCIGGETLVSRR